MQCDYVINRGVIRDTRSSINPVRDLNAVPYRMISKFAALRDDIAAGAISTIIALPSSIAASLLTFAPLGPDYISTAAAAALIGCIVGGGLSAILATSSF